MLGWWPHLLGSLGPLQGENTLGRADGPAAGGEWAGKERRGQGQGQRGAGLGKCLGLIPLLAHLPPLLSTLTKSQYQEDEKQSQEVSGAHGVRRPGTLRRVWGQGHWRHLFLGSPHSQGGSWAPPLPHPYPCQVPHGLTWASLSDTLWFYS